MQDYNIADFCKAVFDCSGGETEGSSLADVEVVVGLEENGDISSSSQQQLVYTSRMLLYETTYVIHLQSYVIILELPSFDLGCQPCPERRRARCADGSACSSLPT